MPVDWSAFVEVVRRHQRFLLTTRSEEHTSELQSHLNLVCRLLLEKKKENPSDQGIVEVIRQDQQAGVHFHQPRPRIIHQSIAKIILRRDALAVIAVLWRRRVINHHFICTRLTPSSFPTPAPYSSSECYLSPAVVLPCGVLMWLRLMPVSLLYSCTTVLRPSYFFF